jgi:hypothetical protein
MRTAHACDMTQVSKGEFTRGCSQCALVLSSSDKAIIALAEYRTANSS